jgi:hypothetical protein
LTQIIFGMVDMAAAVAGHCRFFDYLADLVDPKFYHADDREHINPKYMKHAERAATKRAFKEQYKQNKRAKLDPDAVKTTTELHKKQAQEAAERQAAGEPAGGLAALGTLHLSAGGQPSREELLQRLHAKMEVGCAAGRLNLASIACRTAVSACSVHMERERACHPLGFDQASTSSSTAL